MAQCLLDMNHLVEEVLLEEEVVVEEEILVMNYPLLVMMICSCEINRAKE